MFTSPTLSCRSKIIHLCIFSAIIVISSANFHGWISNQRHKSRYFNIANNPIYVNPSSRYQWPHIGTTKNYQTNLINSAPSKFPRIKPINYHRKTHKQNKLSKPSSSICKKSGYFAYPNDCKKFYRCVATQSIVSEIFSGSNNFNIFHFVCPAGTIFDERVQVCNHPRAVICNTNQNEVGDDHNDIITDVTIPGVDNVFGNDEHGSVAQGETSNGR